MVKKIPIDFIQEKIQTLQTALFFPETSSLLQIPNYIVNEVQTDAEGNAWFIIHKPSHHIDEELSQFHCKLEFFKKGVGYYLKVQGLAKIISRFDAVHGCIAIPGLEQRMENNQVVAICVKIDMAEYFEIFPESLKVSRGAKDLKSYFSHLLPQRNYSNYAFRLS